MNEFSVGIVYNDTNGTATSEYFETVSSYPVVSVVFTINYAGLGLP